MATFLTGEKLVDSVENLIYQAKEFLIIISPYIKLDDYLRSLFDKHKENPRLAIRLIFGKNVGSVSKSISNDDLEYFKEFPNISIIYVPELHAKYYANEKYQIVTSLNLHQHSLKNNLEFGIKLYAFNVRKKSYIDADAWNNYIKIARKYPVIFLRVPKVKKRGLLSHDFTGSETIYDVTEALIKSKKIPNKTVNDFEHFIEIDKKYPKKKPIRNNTLSKENPAIKDISFKNNTTDTQKSRIKETLETENHKQIFLECLKELNRDIGRSFLSKFLSGSSTISNYNPELLDSKFYGIFNSYTQNQVIQFIDLLIEEGLFRKIKSSERPFFPILQITDKGEKYLTVNRQKE